MNILFGNFNFIFYTMFHFVFCIIFIIIVVLIIKNIIIWNKNNHSPQNSAFSMIISKRSHISYHNHHHHVTLYYVTFEFENGDRMEFSVKGSEYGMLKEGDRGNLCFQGTRYLSFERNT